MTDKRFDVLVVGYAGYDLAIGPVPADIMQLDTGTAPQRIITVGGDGANAATCFARIGLETAIVTAVGQDMFAETVREHFCKNGVHTDFIRTLSNVPTNFTLILIGEDGERHCLIRRGCAEHMTPDMIDDDMLSCARHLHYASYFPMTRLDPHAGKLFARAHALGLTTSMDAVTYRGDGDPLAILSDVLQHTDIFLPSYDDAVLIFGTRDLIRMKQIMSRFPLKLFGVKCGAKGLFLTDFSHDVQVEPMARGPVIDTTGAGDSCAAGCAAAFLRGGDVTACAAIASACAAYVVQSMGATTGCRDYASLAELARSFGYSVPE